MIIVLAVMAVLVWSAFWFWAGYSECTMRRDEKDVERRLDRLIQRLR